MQPIKVAVWEKMRSLLQNEDKKPNYRVQAQNDQGVWKTIPKDCIVSIDIDNRLDYTSATCDIVLSNENGRFGADKVGAEGGWKNIFKDTFDVDSSNNYTKVSNIKWGKDAMSGYNSNGVKDGGFNGYMSTHGNKKGAVSELEFQVNLKNSGRLNFDFRKKATQSNIKDGDVIWYDDFRNGLRSEYQFVHDTNADDWAIRDYSRYGGKQMMSSGYTYALGVRSKLQLPIELPCHCILEYKHRLYEPNSGWAYKRQTLYVDGVRPPVPSSPVGYSGSIDYVNGGIEFGGNHGGKGSAYEHHQHLLEPGNRLISWEAYYTDGKELARWEMDYIKIFAFGDNTTAPEGGTVLELLVDDVVVQTWGENDVVSGFSMAFPNWHTLASGTHKIKFRVTNNSNSIYSYVDIDNIIVQEEVPGTGSGEEDEGFSLLLTPNVYVRVDLGYGDSDDDLTRRFTGMIDRVVDGSRGTITIKCRDMLKKLIETMVRPKVGEHSVCYPRNPMDNIWWVASDIIADLINRAGCIAFVERTMIEEGGVESPYCMPPMQFQEGKPIIDCVKEITDNINFRLWANRYGSVCCSKYRYKNQSIQEDFFLDEYVDLTELEYTLDDSEARGKLRVVCTYNNQAEEYMDAYLHHVVCKGEDRYASVETQWMETEAKRRVMAQYMFTQMKRKYKTINVGTVGNPFVDVMDYIRVLETVTQSEQTGRKYHVVGIRTSVSSRGYLDVYDLEYGADDGEVILVTYEWGDSSKNDDVNKYPVTYPSKVVINSPTEDQIREVLNQTEPYQMDTISPDGFNNFSSDPDPNNIALTRTRII